MRSEGMGSSPPLGPPPVGVEPTGAVTVGERSFDDFYRRELAGLVALARALCPPGIAEDIAQEAMLVVYRRWPEVRDLEHPEAYVRRVCANLAVSQFRRRLAEARAFSRSRVPDPGPEHGEHADFWRLVRSLPRRQAQAVALHYLYDLSVADVARTLQVSEGSVKVHLSRARQSLARQLGVDVGEDP
ncbi:SigE family RNA polymerase sigma factor [Pedococcus cremeus]|uniref:SigE family RNA polymerase sigma factor n=1 Tax=Pedococcus cremeus TaxID=587636 RepID=UPI0015A65F67|nr:SigE family RNA polymerase sigma factor [Pedococcus cremeus]